MVPREDGAATQVSGPELTSYPARLDLVLRDFWADKKWDRLLNLEFVLGGFQKASVIGFWNRKDTILVMGKCDYCLKKVSF
ncbi:hypothetical protein NDU88_000122 [Pleurodeles waltl]|nr:hypothetical protein NDU88_000122 [Pleurodeles waltl]